SFLLIILSTAKSKWLVLRARSTKRNGFALWSPLACVSKLWLHKDDMKNIFVIFRLCCIGSLFSLGAVAAQGACDPPPVGLVSWWPGEGNATDAIGTNNGTLENGAGFTTGKVGQTFVFAGSGEAVQLGNPTDLQLQDFTIETWIQRGSASSSTPDPGQTTGVFMGYGYGGYAFGIDDAGGLFQIGRAHVWTP